MRSSASAWPWYSAAKRCQRALVGRGRGAQQRQHVALLVLVVLRRGAVEVAHHVARRIGGHRVGAVLAQVLLQARQQREHARHAIVAGGQHLEGLFEARPRALMQRKDRAHRRSPGASL